MLNGDVFYQRSSTWLWGFEAGPGSFDAMNNIGGSQFVHATSYLAIPTNEPPVGFYVLLASYLGDWNTENNFLRAVLATPNYGLAALYGAFPNWKLGGMALGAPLGESYLRTINEAGESDANRDRILSIIGDPTLRLHVTLPVTNLTRASNTLSWTSGEPGCQFSIYRSSTGTYTGDFIRLANPNPSATSFTDPSAITNSVLYQVRAYKLVTSGSGSYYNLSQGVFKN